jgi:enoyl-CoA hydratase
VTDSIHHGVNGKVAQIVIDREPRRNALDNNALLDLVKILKEIKTKSVSALVISGKGTVSFCAGSDLKALAAYSYAEAIYHTELFLQCTEILEQMPCATIAAIEGFCLGGGLEIALACDSRLCSSNATLGFPEITVGALPTGGGTVSAPRAIGWGRAREMLVFGDRIDATTAHSWGLVSTLVSPGTAVSSAIAKATSYADKVDPQSVALLRQVLVAGMGSQDATGRMFAKMADAVLLDREQARKKMRESLDKT